jgi:hypothetical protein
MFRRALTLTALIAVLAVAGAPTARAATPPTFGGCPTFGRCLDANTIKAALKTATPEEDGFVQHVLDQVDAGKLPRSLVVSTFIWARKKPRWQFQYFRYGLIIRAWRSGIRL